MTQKIRAWIRISQIKDLGLLKIHQLIKRLGEPDNFVGKGLDHLHSLDYINDKVKREIARNRDPENWKQICQLMERFEIRFVSILDEEYPQDLKHIFNPPLFLFYRGNLFPEVKERALAIVGTRKPDNYGIIMTRKITERLVASGFTIVSGLA